jgi:Family of unknown function (DUF5681)
MTSEPASKVNSGWFPKGRSGNRKGRPAARRRSKQDPVLEILSEPITVNGPDGPRDMSQEDVVEWTTFQAALAGKAMATRDMIKWLMEDRAWLAEHAPKPAQRPIEIVAAQHPDNADEALQLLGIAAPYSESMGLTCIPLLLEPWSVQVALGRRRGGNRLTNMRADLRRLTRDPDSLRWPRGTDQ